MKYLHAFAIPLLAVASTPALAAGHPKPQDPSERTAQKLEEDAGQASGTASNEGARAAQVEQQKQAIVDTLKASTSSRSTGIPQDPAVKPSLDAVDSLASQSAKLAELFAHRQAGAKLDAEQSEALRELVKQYIHTRETRLDTLQLNWLNLPVFGMSDEEARAAGYPCIGPDDGPEIAHAPSRSSAPSAAGNAVTRAMIRTARVAHRMATFAAHLHKEHHAMLLAGGQACDDCPDCAEGTCTEGAHSGSRAKDFDCVDCPDKQIA